MKKEERHALVLSGGGAHGAYAIGVMEALVSGSWSQGRKVPVRASIYAGTSVGAYSAAIMAQQEHQDDLEAVRYLRYLWLERIAEVPGHRPNGVFRIRGSCHRQTARERLLPQTLRHCFNIVLEDLVAWAQISLRRGFHLSCSEENLLRRVLNLVDPRDWVSTGPLERLIKKTVDTRKLLQPQARTLQIATTAWEEGKPVIFTNRPESRERSASFYQQKGIKSETEMASAILASASVPGLFPAVRIGGQDLVDGGLLLNAPLRPTLHSGATHAHVIHLGESSEALMGRPQSFLETLEHLALIVPNAQLSRDLELIQLRNELASRAISLRNVLADGPQKFSKDSERQIRPFLKMHADRPPITVHRYFPKNRLGGGGHFFNFHQRRILDLIEQGFNDTVHHDCQANGCIV